jgi:uncharacterized protein
MTQTPPDCQGRSLAFGRDKALIGMVHVQALPGTPRSRYAVAEIAKQAATEAKLLVECGFDAVLLENMHDVPYLLRNVGPEITAAMTAAASAVRQAVEVPLGIQILAGANKEALAAAQAASCQFIRAEGLVFAAVADEGVLAEADAGPLLRYRKQIGAERISIYTDVKKKHSSNALTADVDIKETAQAAEFFGADGVIVTGVATAQPASLEDLAAVRAAVETPVLVGSGVTPDTVGNLFQHANALIVGSWFKRDGVWFNPPERARAEALVKAANAVRG